MLGLQKNLSLAQHRQLSKLAHISKQYLSSSAILDDRKNTIIVTITKTAIRSYYLISQEQKTIPGTGSMGTHMFMALREHPVPISLKKHDS